MSETTLIDRLANAERFVRMTDDGRPEVLVMVRGDDLRVALALLRECEHLLSFLHEEEDVACGALLTRLRAAGVKNA